MKIIKLDRGDYEHIKEQANSLIKQSLISLESAKLMLKWAERELEKWSDTDITQSTKKE